MVTTRRSQTTGYLAAQDLAAQEAIARGGNRALRKYLGLVGARQERPPRRQPPAPPQTPPNAANFSACQRRVRMLEQVVQSLKNGRATALARATKAPKNDYRTANMFAKGPMGYEWDQFGPAWASAKWLQEIAIPNRGPAAVPRSRMRPSLSA